MSTQFFDLSPTRQQRVIRPQGFQSHPCSLALIQGSNDIASAVAVKLAEAGFSILLQQPDVPQVTRRKQAFSDAFFDGQASLVGTLARRANTPRQWVRMQAGEILLTTRPLDRVLPHAAPAVLVDARMRKRDYPKDQRGLAPLVIGLGPNFVAGGNADLVIETAWGDALGRVIRIGATQAFAGEPRPIGGFGRERYVYAPVAGTFRTARAIGQPVAQQDSLGQIHDQPILAPLTGVIRGLLRDGVNISRGTKIVEIVPRGHPVAGMGPRPARIAEGVLNAVTETALWPGIATSAPLRDEFR